MNFTIIFFISIIFFYDYIIYGKLPITNADPSNYFWTHFRNSQLYDYFNFWDSSYGNGISIFSNDIFLSKFSFFSVFLSFFTNKLNGYIFLLWGYVFFSGIIITYYLKKWLKLNFAYCILAYSIFIFCPSYLNDYLFNGFGAFILLPLIFDQCNIYSKNNKILHAIIAGLFLVVIHLLSNIAIVQFCFIVSTFYLFFLIVNHSEYKKKFLLFCKFILIMFFVWLGIMGFYIFPMLYEGINSIRSHTSSSLFTGFKFSKILLYLTFPFTSQIFIDEKVIYTGLLTQFNSINGYVHFFYLPCFFIFLSNYNSFHKREKFIVLYPVFFFFFAWFNYYFPVLGIIQYITKSTGWWRSYPINILFISISIAIVFSKIITGKITFRGFLFYISKLILYLLFFVYLIGFILFLYLIYLYFYDIDNLEKISLYLTNRPFENIRNYLDSYYFIFPVVYFLFTIILSNNLSLLIFTIFLNKDLNKKFNQKKSLIYSLLFFILVGQLTLNKIYYPFNSGIFKSQNLAENKFISKLDKTDLIAIIFNDTNEIEKHVTLKNNLKRDITSLELELALQSYPEFNRFQSNNTMFGAFFSTIGANVYTKGTNFTRKRISSFHEKLIQNDPIILNKFKNGKTYLRIGKSSIDSNLIKIAGINYLLSSLDVNNPNYEKVFNGDYYKIYKNKTYMKKYFFAKKIFNIQNEKQRLEFLDSEFFNINNDIIIEDNDLYDFKTTFTNLDFFEYNKLDKLKLKTNSNKESFFFIRENFHPGWNIYVNKNKTKIYKANHLFMAIKLPSGKNIITLDFIPPYFYFGLFITCLTLLVITIFIFHYFRKYKL